MLKTMDLVRAAFYRVHRRFRPVALGGLLLLMAPAAADADVAPSGRLAQAEAMLSWNVMPRLVGGTVVPHWLRDGNRFWYRREDRDGWCSRLVDPARRGDSDILDRARLAEALTAAGVGAVPADRLPVSTLAEPEDGQPWIAVIDRVGHKWRCRLAARYICAAAGASLGRGEVASPDGRWIAYLDKDNLFVRPAYGGAPVQLTRDGNADRRIHRTGEYDDASYQIDSEQRGTTAPDIAWSPDSRRLFGWVVDTSGVRRFPLVQAAPAGKSMPRLFTLRHRWAGDADIGTSELRVFDIAGRTLWTSPSMPWWHSSVTNTSSQLSRWDGGDRISWAYIVRGGLRVVLNSVELGGDQPRSRQIYAETGTSPVHLCADYYCFTHASMARLIDGGRRLIWPSERSGWAHFYLIDTATGRVLRQLTKGAWAVMDLVGVDEDKGVVYFTATGRESGDPYLRRLYSVRLDGGAAPRLLTPEDAYHFAPSLAGLKPISPSGHYLVDSFSRFDRSPRAVLRTTDGALLRPLEESDDRPLRAAGWRPPEPFQVTAADGKTQLYGLLYHPSDFDPAKRYPVLVDYYPGPFTTHVRKLFGQRDTDEQPQAAAEAGFVVIQLDARGTEYRSRAFREIAYGNMGIGGIPDYAAAITQLARRLAYLDTDRVGIYGLSAGGDLAFPALAQFPDLFKVALVSGLSGRTYVTHEPEYGEAWLPLPVGGPAWDRAANTHWMPLIRDDSLIILAGEMDDHGDPAFTVQMVDDLVRADKRFQFFTLPNVDHVGNDVTRPGFPYSPAFFRYRWRFLIDRLGTSRETHR